MIRLGTLVGYAFEGPLPLGATGLPAEPGVFAVMVALQSPGTSYVGIDIDDAPNLAEAVGPGHPRAACWADAGGTDPVVVAHFVIQGDRASIRAGVARELRACYDPPCGDPLPPQDRPPPDWPGDRGPGGGGPAGVREPRRPPPFAGEASEARAAQD